MYMPGRHCEQDERGERQHPALRHPGLGRLEQRAPKSLRASDYRGGMRERSPGQEDGNHAGGCARQTKPGQDQQQRREQHEIIGVQGHDRE